MTAPPHGWVIALPLVTAAWVSAAVAGWDLPFDTTPLGVAAAAATAALIGAAWRPRTGRAAIFTGAGLLLLPLAVAQAAGGSAALLAGTLLAAATAEVGATVWSHRSRRENLSADAAGDGMAGAARSSAAGVAALVVAAGCLVAAIFLETGESLTLPLPSQDLTGAALGVTAAVMLLLVATLGPPRGIPLAVPGLLIGLVAVSGLPAAAVAVAGTAAAVLWALLVPERPTPALGSLALAAVALPVAGEASSLLAAAAVLALAVPWPASALLGLPGAAALASVLAAEGVDERLLVVLAGTAVTALALSRGGTPSVLFVGADAGGSAVASAPGAAAPGVAHRRAAAPFLPVLPAAALAVWLVLMPGSWGWTGASGLGTYDRGALAACAAALLALVGRRARQAFHDHRPAQRRLRRPRLVSPQAQP